MTTTSTTTTTDTNTTTTSELMVLTTAVNFVDLHCEHQIKCALFLLFENNYNMNHIVDKT